MKLFYTFSILLYVLGIRCASLFNSKARAWVQGRKDQFRILKEKAISVSLDYSAERVWIHCASLGEFEQGRPLLELIRNQDPSTKIILTFYSPSGYEVRKNYPLADIVVYLPADLPSQAARFLDIIRPTKVVFVKYEFWFNFLNELSKRNIPHFLISGIFRPKQLFFKPYGRWFRQSLADYNFLFLQDQGSYDLLHKNKIESCAVNGDTRFDRVHQLAGEVKSDSVAEEFSANAEVLVAGSTWEEDEELLCIWMTLQSKIDQNFKLILAPHDTSEARLRSVESRFIAFQPVRYSHFKNNSSAQVLLVDHIGSLSSLYKYGQYAFTGGGFGKGIHNILEAAVYGKPVFFGPNYPKFREAVDLVKAGGAFSITKATELKDRINFFRKDPVLLQMASLLSKEFVLRRTGATQAIYNKIFKT